MKDGKRILLGHQIAKSELAAMMLTVPVTERANVQQEAKLIMDAAIAIGETEQRFFAFAEPFVRQCQLAVKNVLLAHAAQSFLCIP